MIRYVNRGLPHEGTRWSRGVAGALWEYRDGHQDATHVTPPVDNSDRSCGDDVVFDMIQHAPTLFGRTWGVGVQNAHIPGDFNLSAYDPVFSTAEQYDCPISIHDLSTFRILCFSERPGNNYYDIGVLFEDCIECLAYNKTRVRGMVHSADMVSPDQRRLIHAMRIGDAEAFTATAHRAQIVVSSWSISHTLSTFPLSAIVYLVDGRAYVQSVDNDPRQVGTDTAVGRVATLCHSSNGTRLIMEDPSFEGHTAIASSERLGRQLVSASTAAVHLTRSMHQHKVPVWDSANVMVTTTATDAAPLDKSDPQTQLPVAVSAPSTRWRVVSHTPLPDDVRVCLGDCHMVAMDAHGIVSQLPTICAPSVNPAALYVAASGALAFRTKQPWAMVASGGDAPDERTTHQTLLWLTEKSLTDAGRRQMLALAHECGGRAHPTHMNDGVILVQPSSSDTLCTFNCVPLVGDNTLVAAVTLDPLRAVALPCSTWRHPVTMDRPVVGEDMTNVLLGFLQQPAARPTTWTHQLTLHGLGADAVMDKLVDHIAVRASAKHATQWEDAALLLSLSAHSKRDLWVGRMFEGLRIHTKYMQENACVHGDAALKVARLAEQVYHCIDDVVLREALRDARSQLRAERQRTRSATRRIRSFLNTHFFKRLSDLGTGRASTKERTAGGLEREERMGKHRSTYQTLRAQGADAMSEYMDGDDGEGSGLRWLYLPVDDENMWAFLRATKSMDHSAMHITSPFVDRPDAERTNDTLTLDHVTSQSLLLIPSAQRHPFRPIDDADLHGMLVPAVCHAETARTMMVMPVAAIGTADVGWTFNARVHGVEHERMAVLRSMLTDTLLGKGTGVSTRHRDVAGDVGVDVDSHEAAWGFIHLTLHTIRYLHKKMPVVCVDADSSVARLFRALWDTTLVAMGAGSECALTSLADLSGAGRPSSAQCLADHEWAIADTLLTCAFRAGVAAEDVHRRFTHFLSRRLHKVLVQPIVLRIEQSRTSALLVKRDATRKLESRRAERCHRLLVGVAMRCALAGQTVKGDAWLAVRELETGGTVTQRGRRRFWGMLLDGADDCQLLRGCGMGREEGVRWRAFQTLTRDLRDRLNCMKGDVRVALECAVKDMGDVETRMWSRLTDKEWCRAVTREARNERVALVSGPTLVKIVKVVDAWLVDNTARSDQRVPLRTWCWTEWAMDGAVTARSESGGGTVAVVDTPVVTKAPLPRTLVPEAIRSLVADSANPTECTELVQQALSTSPTRLQHVLGRMGWTVGTLARGVVDAATVAWDGPSGKMVGAWPFTEHAMIEYLCRNGGLHVV